MEFNPGDIVRLRSGGPNMMVERVVASSVLCVWFEDGRRRKGRFTFDTIEKVLT